MSSKNVSEASMRLVFSELRGTTPSERSMRTALIDELLGHSEFSFDEALALSLMTIDNEFDIGIIPVCIRNGANPNTYVSTPTLGDAHVLVSAFYSVPENVYPLVYSTLVFLGSNPNSPCFDPSTSNIVYESAADWLLNRGIKLPHGSSELLEAVKTLPYRESLCLSVYVNTDFVVWTPDALPFMLTSRNPNWAMVANPPNDPVFLRTAFRAVFPDLFINILNSGIRPSYYDIVSFISHMTRVYRIQNSHPLREMCRTMILACVQRGIPLDSYELDWIRGLDPEFAVLIEREYKRPLWKKVCSIDDGYIPKEFTETIVFFGLPEHMNKHDLCRSFEEITSADMDSLVRAFRKKNARIMSSRINTLRDFINYDPTAMCDNPESITGDAMDYSERALAYYKDESGKNWCFLSNSYDSLLNTQTNPINGQSLPLGFIETVRGNAAFLNAFGIPLHDPRTIQAIMDKMRTSDELVNAETNTAVDRVQSVLNSRGVTKDVLVSMSTRETASRLSKLNININDYIEDFTMFDIPIREYNINATPELVYVLVCRLLYTVFSNDIQRLNRFMD
jgi:hypothetical protein